MLQVKFGFNLGQYLFPLSPGAIKKKRKSRNNLGLIKINQKSNLTSVTSTDNY